MSNEEVAQLEAELIASKPVITLEWENGVFVSNPIPFSSKADAFGAMDQLIAGALFPASISVVLKENGKQFWHQHGTHQSNWDEAAEVEL
jgi:hypothetical protein